MKATLRKTDDAATSAAGVLPPNGATVQLSRTSGASVRGARGWTVRALSGSVWITQDGDIRDVVLEPGESHVLDRDGPALLWSLGDGGACLSLTPRDPAPRARPAALPLGRPAFA
ncbi:MAG TPA: DUF2917 domain-containing protein [Noviherbaspirillum sp.]|uniref:DUF2917 domain-containing protein n=1 Tax=Noviherbaspirillum sp. TaxID=1926288 RepID=UPI002F9500FA